VPIADCGFPPLVPVQGAGGQVQIQAGGQLLMFVGPTIKVEVDFDPAFFHTDPAQIHATMVARSVSASQLVDALVDTGAQESCIDEELAKTLQLPLIDQGKASGVGGPDVFNMYLGHIRIVALNHIQYGRFLGVKLREGNQPHRAILGRSVLQAMIFSYDGRTGACTLAM
jgi:predicted aspartyl protease